MEQNQVYENPVIKPFLQNTLNPSELELLADHFTTGWTSRYNTIQVAVSSSRLEELSALEDPRIKPFIKNPLNPAESQKSEISFTTGWTSRYNTIQGSVSYLN